MLWKNFFFLTKGLSNYILFDRSNKLIKFCWYLTFQDICTFRTNRSFCNKRLPSQLLFSTCFVPTLSVYLLEIPFPITSQPIRYLPSRSSRQYTCLETNPLLNHLPNQPPNSPSTLSLCQISRLPMRQARDLPRIPLPILPTR